MHPQQNISGKASDGATGAHVADLIERNCRQVEQLYPSPPAFEIARFGVVGAGAMGTRIAAAGIARGLPVTIVDADEQAVHGAPRRVRALTEAAAGGRQLAPGSVDAMLRCASDLSALADCDLVIESVPEKTDLKRAVLADVERVASSHAVLATNTSTIPIERLAWSVKTPERLCGVHFMMTPAVKAIVELVPGPQTSHETVANAIGFCGRVDHMPLIVRDGPGFAVNRLLMSYLSAGLDLLLAGVDLVAIEDAARQFGMTLGPFRFYDEIGLDVAIHCGFTLAGTSDQQLVRSPLLVRMVKAGHLGRKTGHGFFSYSEPSGTGDACGPHGDTQTLISRWAASPPSPLSRQGVMDALVLPMVLEATRLLAEGRVRDPGQIDLVAMFGLGFPTSRGGLLYWADGLGAALIAQMLGSLADLSPRYRPTSALLEMAAHHRRFYPATA